MGHVKGNLVTKGFSGKMGDEIVFRQVGGRTIFSKRPEKRTTFTPAQAAQRTVFQKAVYFARTALISPAIRADYAQAAKDGNLKSAYVAAVTDYLTDPEIASVYTEAYKGNAGDTILASAVIDFKIVEVAITIQLADNTTVETGFATRVETGWLYTAQQPNGSLKGSKVTVTMKDRLNKTAVLINVM